MRKAVKIGFIGVFCAVIGLAFPVFNIFSKQLSMDSHENRLMTGLPQVLQSPLRELPRNLDNFLVDNSPFRYQFVLVNAGLDYALFGTSQSCCPARTAGCSTRTAPTPRSRWQTIRGWPS